MNLLDTQNQINELMTKFVTKVKGFTAMKRSDINQVSETILLPLLSKVYDYQNLKNLNHTSSNYPAIDLGDEIAKVCFQITATPDSTKIKETLEKFIKYKLYEKYDRLIIYIITEKQKTYSGNGFQQIIQDKFEFNQESDIKDYRDILQEVTNFQIEKADQIRQILENNFGNKRNIYLFDPRSDKKTEEVILNLLELKFPEKLYISNLSISRDKIIGNSINSQDNFKLNNKSSWKDIVRAALKQKGLKFSSDWTTHSGKLITFHDLTNNNLPLSHIIDSSTIEVMDCQDYYSYSLDQERVFKILLGQCLKNYLYHRNVKWQNEDKLFIFSLLDNQDKRTETWSGEKDSTRTVCGKIMKEKNPDQILHYKHFAFKTEYKQFAGKWYLLINPEWFFSFDGYKKSFYHKDSLSWLKRHENNKNVRNHLRFIVEFLKKDIESSLFNERNHNKFLSFGDLVSFDNSPYLDDQEWLTKNVDLTEASQELVQPEPKRRTRKKKAEQPPETYTQLSIF